MTILLARTTCGLSAAATIRTTTRRQHQAHPQSTRFLSYHYHHLYNSKRRELVLSSAASATTSVETASPHILFPLRRSAVLTGNNYCTGTGSGSSSSRTRTLTMRLRHRAPLLFSVAAAFSYRSLHSTTLGEAAARQMQEDEQQEPLGGRASNIKRHQSHFAGDCPFYGCPLTPQDVHYNTEKVKQAFEDLRNVPRAKSDATDTTKAAQGLLESSGNTDAVTLTLIGYKGGMLTEQINQDRAVVLNPFRVAADDGGGGGGDNSEDSVLLGVFDGHAPRGEIVSEYTKDELPNLISTRLSEMLKEVHDEIIREGKIKQMLIDAFVELDENAPAEESGGCTCTMVLMRNGKIYVANAGDSRSFLVAYRPSTQKSRVLYVSREDKPDLPDEKSRVEKMGGQVYIPVRGTSRVVYHDPRTGAPSGLAMSRSIGDWAAGKLGVIPDPLVEVFDVSELVDVELSENTTTNTTGSGGGTGDDGKDDNQNLHVEDEQQQYEISYSGETLKAGSPIEKGTAQRLPVKDDVYIFAVSATDGMMDYLEASDIGAVLAKSLYEKDGAHPITAAEHLVFAAANAWQQEKLGRYRDDIAIAVSTLRKPPTRPKTASECSAEYLKKQTSTEGTTQPEQ